MAEKPAIQVKVRMPAAVHRKLMRDADRSGQTLNAEILRRLETSYQSDRLFEGILAPDNAKLIRMIGQAVMLAGDWRGDKTRFDALDVAITYILYAAAVPLMGARDEIEKTKVSKFPLQDASDEIGGAIAQLVVANEMPQTSMPHVMEEHAHEGHRRQQQAKERWRPREKAKENRPLPSKADDQTPLSKLRELEELTRGRREEIISDVKAQAEAGTKKEETDKND